MTLLGKIRLSERFGRASYVISAIVSAAMAVYVVYEPMTMPVCFILKLLSLPCVWYLRVILTRGLGMYFYLNLGISRKEYWLIPIAVEFVAFVALMIVAGIIGHAIG